MYALDSSTANFIPVTLFFLDVKHEAEEKVKACPYNIVKTALETLNRPATPVIVLSYLSNSSTKKYLLLFSKEDPELQKLNQLFNEIHQQIAQANTIKDAAQKNRTKFDLAQTLAKAGDINGALQIVDTLSNSSKKYALSGITTTLLDFNDVERAKKLALSIENSKPGRTARMHVSKALAKAGKIDDALKFAYSIPVESLKVDKSLKSIVKKLSELGEFDRAITIMKDMFCCVDARETIMLEMFKKGLKQQALQLLKEMLSDKSRMDTFLKPISNKLMEEGFSYEALQVIRAMSQIESKYYQYISFIYGQTQPNNVVSNVLEALRFVDIDFMHKDKFYDQFSKSDIYVKDSIIEKAVQKLMWSSEFKKAREVANTISSPEGKERLIKTLAL
jgi:hypothetical protein